MQNSDFLVDKYKKLLYLKKRKSFEKSLRQFFYKFLRKKI